MPRTICIWPKGDGLLMATLKRFFLCRILRQHDWLVTWDRDSEFGTLLCRRCGKQLHDYWGF